MSEYKPDKIYKDEEVSLYNPPYGLTQEQLIPGLHYPKTTGGSNFKVGAFNITSTGSISVTGVGFKPKLLQVYSGRNNGADSEISLGVSDGTSSFAYINGTGSSASGTFINLRNSGDTLITMGTLTGFDADGFTINITTHTSATTYVNYIAFG